MSRPFLLIALIATLTGCDPIEPAAGPVAPPEVKLPTNYKTLTADEAQKLVLETKDLLIIDVRTETEFGQSRIPGAELYDYLRTDDTTQRFAKLDRKRPCLLYCAIGGRAELAAAIMAQQGFEHIFILAGGFNEWRKQGKPYYPKAFSVEPAAK